MPAPAEDRNCYEDDSQREVLLRLLEESIVDSHFFLTGGTALSVFYLHHRRSNDLDFFCRRSLDLSEIAFAVKRIWPGNTTILKESNHFVSCLIHQTKVDFVIDPLSIDEERPIIDLGGNHRLRLDTVHGIASNKLTAVVSRTEPKDYIDLYFLFQRICADREEEIYSLAQQKDAIFDDPPTVAFQIEEGISFVKNNQRIIPALLVDFDSEDFFRFYEKFIVRIYQRFRYVQPG